MSPLFSSRILSLTEPPIRVDPSCGALLGPEVTRIERRLIDLKDIFESTSIVGQMDPQTLVYRVESYTPVTEGTDGGLFFGATFLEPGLVGNEYFMTKGHFHSKIQAAEYYWCVRGQGVLLLMNESRHCSAQSMQPGSLHYIPGRTAHRVANVGVETLCFGACWPADAGHDYQTIARDGFAARVRKIDGQPQVVDAGDPR